MADDREGESDNTEDERPDEPELDGDANREVLAEFLAQFAGGGYRFSIHRREPKQYAFNGQVMKVGGHLETVTEPPTPEYLFQMWGGGVYDIRVLGPSKDNRGLRFITQRAIDIAGEPHWKEGEVWVDGSVSDDFAIDWSGLRNGLLTIGINLCLGLARRPLASTSVIGVIRASISNLISAADRKRIEDAPPHAIVANVPLSIDPLDFAIPAEQKRQLVGRGYRDTLRLLSRSEIIGSLPFDGAHDRAVLQ